AEDVANVFYQTPRAVTSALRAASDSLNKVLLDRNMNSSNRGQYTLAWLALAAVRENQSIFSLCGPMHAYWFSANGTRHFFEPSISGKGLGSSQTINIHYAQSDLNANDMLLFCGRVPNAWVTPLEDAQPSSFDAMRRRLTSITNEDLNAVLVQTPTGTGAINLLRGNMATKIEAPVEAPTETIIEAPVQEQPQIEEPTLEEEPAPQTSTPDLPATYEPESTPEGGAHLLQPATYPVVPPQREETFPISTPSTDPLSNLPHRTGSREFPASIPRAKPRTEAETPAIEEKPIVEKIEPKPEPVQEIKAQSEPVPEIKIPEGPREPSPQAKQAAKIVVNIMQGFRTGSASLSERFRNFLPRLLPAEEQSTTSVSANAFMGFMAVLIPLIVVTLAVVVYLRYGRNEQYEAYYNQALQMKQQALALTNPVEQRIAWENVLANLDQAENHNVTSDTMNLRQEAEAKRDQLLGISRMQFNPAFTAKLGIDVSRMAATENDLYLLNAANGEVLRAIPAGNGGFELDNTFN
ncbi:MAG TPA: hypothetical protein PKJ84_14670, partial [Anaerolineales bacterium]|nr:hypothetical protein [Anaerolineales bacterium]